MLDAARARDGDNVRRPRQHPDQRQFRDAHLRGLRQGVRLSPQRLIVGIMSARKARHTPAYILLGEGLRVYRGIGQKSARQGAKRHKGGALSPALFEHADLGVARPQGIFALHGGDRMHAVSAAQGLGGHLRQSDRADFARCHQIRHRANGFLNGHGAIEAMQVIQVDGVGFETLQTGVAKALYGLGPAVEHAPPIVVTEYAFAGEDILAAPSAEDGADQGFVGALAVQRGGVEKIAARIERAVQQPRRTAPGDGRPVGVAHIHAAQPQRVHLKRPEGTFQYCALIPHRGLLPHRGLAARSGRAAPLIFSGMSFPV